MVAAQPVRMELAERAAMALLVQDLTVLVLAAAAAMVAAAMVELVLVPLVVQPEQAPLADQVAQVGTLVVVARV